MRPSVAALAVVSLLILLLTSSAPASPSEVNVRIEGKAETLFEGPILTDGHKVKASSDKAARRCNGLNNGQNTIPGPTPTAASVDAMSILGEDFDARWYPEPFEDYFITRWGPDGQNEANGEYWGLLVNNVFTSVGGCQYELDDDDEVVWAYDAFKARPFLALFPASYAGGSRPLTAMAELNQPFEVEVDTYADDAENAPPESPQRTGSTPFEGAEVAPVVAGPGGFESIDVEDTQMVVTDGDGRASISFEEPGWHRIKATVVGPGGEEAIRSNRLDVCVPEPPAVDCGSLPLDDEVRMPPAVEEEEPEPEEPRAGDPGHNPTGPNATVKGGGASTPTDASQLRLRLLRIDRSRIARGFVTVSWRVLEPGGGVEKWEISARGLGQSESRDQIRATGRRGTSATLRLRRGAAYRLRLTVTDRRGRAATIAIGRIRVPS